MPPLSIEGTKSNIDKKITKEHSIVMLLFCKVV